MFTSLDTVNAVLDVLEEITLGIAIVKIMARITMTPKTSINVNPFFFVLPKYFSYLTKILSHKPNKTKQKNYLTESKSIGLHKKRKNSMV